MSADLAAGTWQPATAGLLDLALALALGVLLLRSPHAVRRGLTLRVLPAFAAGLALTLRHWRHRVSPTGVQPIILGENAAALHAQAGLAEAGLWVPAIRPPTVAPGTSRLRLTLCATHTADDVDRLPPALNQLDRDWTEHAHG